MGYTGIYKFTKDEMRPFKDKWTLQNNAVLALKCLLAEGVDIHTACSRLGDVYHGAFAVKPVACGVLATITEGTTLAIIMIDIVQPIFHYHKSV